MNCQDCKITFAPSENELALYKKFAAAPAELCFDCDQKRRLCYRNERSLYSRKCDAIGETIISIYAPDSPYKAYKSDYWYGDKWDALAYGRDFDFTRAVRRHSKQLCGIGKFCFL